MATNRNATIRYNTLDKCFQNHGRKFFIDDLIEECNRALLDFDHKSQGVKRRQIYDDIRFMQSEQGWAIPLERKKDGKKVYMRYADKEFSINKQPLNQLEAQQLQESLLTLSRFKGIRQFEWIKEVSARLEQSFQLGTQEEVISFEENPYLKGLDFLDDIYDAITKKQALKIIYKPYNKNEITCHIHPWYLKQYNNRWFLFALDQDNNYMANFPLDRIKSIEISLIPYILNTKVDFNEFFEDAIGVTIYNDRKPQKVKLKIDSKLWPYIETKPLHGSQRIKEQTDDFTIVSLEVLHNYELESTILFYGEKITVLEPESLSKVIKERVTKIFENYR